VAKLGPGEITAAQTRAEKEQTDRQGVINEANSAQQTQATLTSMRNELGNLMQGPFAERTQTVAKYLRLIDPSWDKQVASYEDYVKNAGAVVRQVHPRPVEREAVQGMVMIQNTLPSPDLSPIGLRRVQNEMLGVNDYSSPRRKRNRPGNSSTAASQRVCFQTAFQNQVSPTASS